MAAGLKSVLKWLVGHTETSWPRVVMNRETEDWIRALPTAGMDALEISGTSWKDKVPFKSYRAAHYPEFDVCAGPLPERYDLIFAEQVFEHLLHPLRAAQNIHQMLREGGYFLVTTPFLIKVHARPTDCTRWTPQGMAALLEDAGFDPGRIRTGSWGNRACVKYSMTKRNYCRRIHSLRNEPDFPVEVWALAQK